MRTRPEPGLGSNIAKRSKRSAREILLALILTLAAAMLVIAAVSGG